jgi:hypothetical protein
MQDQWFGDKRDLVKWGVLVELASRHGLKHILQVPYNQDHSWDDLVIDGEAVKVPPQVLKHFRSATSVSDIQCSARIEMFSLPFRDGNGHLDRENYLQQLLESIRSREEHPGVVFLDPDTGLEPLSGRATEKHVLATELVGIWRALTAGDFLVLYQHQTNRDGTEWIEPKKRQFEQALQCSEVKAKIAQAPGIASDVAFFFVEKGE